MWTGQNSFSFRDPPFSVCQGFLLTLLAQEVKGQRDQEEQPGADVHPEGVDAHDSHADLVIHDSIGKVMDMD